MPLDHANFDVKLGALLAISDSYRKIWEYHVLASNASHYARKLSAANGFGQSDSEEVDVYETMRNFYRKQSGPAIAGLFAAHYAKIKDELSLFGLLQKDLPATEEEEAGGDIEYEYEDNAGVITIIRRRGVWGALRKDMELAANAYYVVANGITFGTFTAMQGNRGDLAVTSMTGESHCCRGQAAGTLVLTVISEDVTATKFRANVELSVPLVGGQLLIEAETEIQAEKSCVDGQTGLTMVLTRPGLAAPIEGGDNGNMFATTTFATPAEGDMNGGVLYVKVTRQTEPDWLVEFYNSSARTVRIGSTSFDGTTGTVALDVTLKNGTRFQTTFSKVNAAALLTAVGNTDEDITFDIDQPRIGDRWTRSITNDQAGAFSTKLAALAPVSLPTTGTNLYVDADAAAITI